MQVTPPATPGNTSLLSRGASFDQSPTGTPSAMPAAATVSPGWGSSSAARRSIDLADKDMDKVVPTPQNTAPPQYAGHPHLIATNMPGASLEELQRARAQRMKDEGDAQGEAAAADVRHRLAASPLTGDDSAHEGGGADWQDVVRRWE